jgi:hypothetical protein
VKNLLIYLSVFTLFLSACDRQLPEVEKSYAIFYIEGEIEGNPINLRAGDDKNFMYSSFLDDTLDIRSFVGKVGQLNCVNSIDCPGSIEISFREREKENGVRLGIDRNIKVSSYDFRGPPKYLFKSFKATFISKSTPSGLAHTWTFGDGGTSYDDNPVHYYLDENDSIVNPELTVQSNGGCSSVISYPVHINSACNVDFSFSNSFPFYSFSARPKFNRSELWDFANGGYLPFGNGNDPPFRDSVFTACIQSIDTLSGCVSYKCKNVIMDTSKVGCVANFDVVKETILIKDVRDYFEVTVKWQNEEGKVYDSHKYVQPEDSQFEITEVEDFINDENGNPTKMLAIAFTVRLYGDDESDFVNFESTKSVIAISYR